MLNLPNVIKDMLCEQITEGPKLQPAGSTVSYGSILVPDTIGHPEVLCLHALMSKRSFCSMRVTCTLSGR